MVGLRDERNTVGGAGELRTACTAPPGGVMTDEVGVITGELELATRCEGGNVTVHVRYAGAEEWYRLSAADCRLYDERDHQAVHSALTGLLHRPTAHLRG